MPRLAFLLLATGLLAILFTLALVLGEAMLPGRVPPFLAAALAGAGGMALVGGLVMVEPGRGRQPFSG